MYINYIDNVHKTTSTMYIKLHPQCTYNYIYNVHITTSTIIYKTNMEFWNSNYITFMSTTSAVICNDIILLLCQHLQPSYVTSCCTQRCMGFLVF